jgi:hypothetical protein
MAIGGPGEEQNSVLARAVIGGLLVGTLTTLFVVPYVYSAIHELKDRFQGRLRALPTRSIQTHARCLSKRISTIRIER